MAAFVNLNGYLTVNTVDLTDHVEDAVLEAEVDEVDFTNQGSAGNRELKAGLKKYSLKITFQEDYAAAKVYATISAAFGTAVAFALRPTSGAIATTNPEFQGSVLVSKWTPVNVKVGEKVLQQVTWPVTGALTTDTTP